MLAHIIEARNAFDYGIDREIHSLAAPATVSAWIEQTGFDPNASPTVCIYNGDALMRADWALTEIRDGDLVCFVRLPAGGDSNPLRIVLQIALYAASAWMIAQGGWYIVAAGAVAVGGQFLINALVPLPKPPSAFEGEASPTYSIGAQGNAARLGSPIPVQYGKHRSWPDLAADPYYEFSGQEQYLYQLFCLGLGEFEIHNISIENTRLAIDTAGTLTATANFDNVEFEVVPPGQKVTLFPSNVATSALVAGQEMLGLNEVGADWIGPFPACAAGETVNRINVDIALPSGLYYANDSGGLDQRAIHYRFEYREITDAGTPAPGAVWLELVETSYLRASITPLRYTHRKAVFPARYEVRGKRLNNNDDNIRAQDTLTWIGLRGYIPDDNLYAGVTLIAVRMQASEQLSQQAARRFNVLATRKLPAWSSAGGWTALIATRSVVWAAVDCLRASYGAQMPDNRIALAELESLNTLLQARGDFFDARFDQTITVGEALSLIARCGRAFALIEAGIMRLVRDGPVTLNTAMYNMRSIVRGSFSVNYLLPTRDSADDVRVKYISPVTWAEDDVLAKLPDSDQRRPAIVRLFGCTQRAQALREGYYMAADNRYRRRFIKFRTPLEGHIPRIGDQCAIAHDMPGWGQSGELIGYQAGAVKTFTCSEPLDFASGTHYLALRRADGSVTGVIIVLPGAQPNQCQSEEALDFTPYTGADKERTYYTFGPGETWALRGRLIGRRPRGLDEVELTFVGEVDTVHTADQGVITEPPPVSQLPVPLDGPIVTGLTVTQAGTPALPRLAVSWSPAQGAQYYVVEYSSDGQEYIGIRNIRATRTAFAVEPGLAYVRVAAVGVIKGPWVVWTGTAGAGIPAPGNILNLRLARPFNGPVCQVAWDAAARARHYIVQVWQGGQVRREVTQHATEFAYSADDSRDDGGPWRAFEIKVTAVGAGAAQSPVFGVLAVNNPQVGALANITIREFLKAIVVGYDRPAAPDFAGAIIYLSQTNNFTAGPANLRYQGPDRSVVLDIATEGQWYMRIAGYDAWGTDSLTLSAQFNVTIATAAKLLAELAGQITETQLYADLNARINSGADAGLIAAQKIIKVDQDGHIAGIGVGVEGGEVGPPTSDIIMLADRFSIALPAHPWEPGRPYTVGFYVKPVAEQTGFFYRCIVAGTSGASEPDWPSGGGATVVLDNFAGTNGTALSAHTPDSDTEGGGWTTAGAPVIQGNNLSLATASDQGWINAGVIDQKVSALWNAGGADNRVSLRACMPAGPLATTVGYRLRIDSGAGSSNIKLLKDNGDNTQSTLDSGFQAFNLNTDYDLQLEVETSGTAKIIRGYIDGVLKVDATDNSPYAGLGTYAGFVKGTHVNANCYLDAFRVQAFVGGGGGGQIGDPVADGGVTWETIDYAQTIPFVVGLVNGQPALVLRKAFIADASIDSAKIGAAAIDTAHIINGSIVTAKIAEAAITAAKIGDAQINNAKIVNAAVDTLKIAGDAVTIPVSGYTGGSLDLTTAFQILSTATIVSTGAPINVMLSAAFAATVAGAASGDSNSIEVRLLRDGNVVWGPFGVCSIGAPLGQTHSNSEGFGANVRHQPGAGSYTYSLQARKLNGLSSAPATAAARSILLLETKR